MGNIFYFDWEISIIEWLQSFESSVISLIFEGFTLLGDEYLLIFILGLFYWCINKELGKKISLTMIGSMMFGTLLKGIALRRRPYMDNSTVKCIRPAHTDADIMSPIAQGFSLPSLHSTISVSTFGTIAKNYKKKVITVLAILLPLLIGISRAYFGVHYPTDIIAGWTLGIISLFAFSFIEKKYGYKIGYLIILLIGACGFFYCSDDEFFSCYGVALGLLLGFIYEEKRVNFTMSKKWWSIVLRPVLGIMIFIIVNTILKLPVQNLTSDNYASLLLIYRLLRYTISTFIIIGLYPHIFRKSSENHSSEQT